MTRFRVYDSNAKPVDQCQGPAWSGACSRPARGQIIACAGGSIVVVLADGGQAITIEVEPDARICPLAVLDLFLAGDAPAVSESEDDM